MYVPDEAVNWWCSVWWGMGFVPAWLGLLAWGRIHASMGAPSGKPRATLLRMLSSAPTVTSAIISEWLRVSVFVWRRHRSGQVAWNTLVAVSVQNRTAGIYGVTGTTAGRHLVHLQHRLINGYSVVQTLHKQKGSWWHNYLCAASSQSYKRGLMTS